MGTSGKAVCAAASDWPADTDRNVGAAHGGVPLVRRLRVFAQARVKEVPVLWFRNEVTDAAPEADGEVSGIARADDFLLRILA